MFQIAKSTSLVLSSILCVGLSIEGKTYWSKLPDNSQCRVPAGQEGSVIMNACRAKVNEDLIVGKVWAHKGITCMAAYRGGNFGSDNFEVRSY